MCGNESPINTQEEMKDKVELFLDAAVEVPFTVRTDMFEAAIGQIVLR